MLLSILLEPLFLSEDKIMLLSHLLDYLLLIRKQHSFNQQAFTLIELLVVILIMGVLSTIALPILLNQGNRARQTEAQSFLGSINRSQQTFRFENGIFSNDINELDVTFTEEYYSYSVDELDGSRSVTHQAIAEDTFEDDLRNYASGLYYVSSETRIIAITCESNNIGDEISVDVDNNNENLDCDEDSSKLQ